MTGRSFRELMKVVPTPAGRQELLDLGRRAHQSSSSGARAPGAHTRELQEVLERIRFHLRAARYPIPTCEELESMLNEHFDADTPS